MRGPAPREPGRRAARLFLPIAAAAFIISGRAQADEFFLLRDENPLTRGFYLPLPSDGRLTDGADLSATLSVSNTLNVENRANESLLVDGENHTLRLSYEDALFQSWRFRFTVPIINDSGGFLDSTIDHWHRWFGFNPGNRPFYPQNELVYSYSGRGSIDLTRSQTSIGDISGELGWYPIDDAHRTVSVWGGLEAPTGSVAKLTGDGAWDGAVWAHGALRWTQWQLAAELGVTQPFGDEIFAGAAHRTSLFARFAATRALGSAWALRAQLDGQTGRVEDSTLRFLGPSLQLTVGAIRRLGQNWRVEFGFAEDAAVNTAPDITFFLGIRRQSSAK
ncbi:MAG TPA: DUF3187 family protein [Steroidobacteraceae bacterium]|nr:DUF3187 family protein [Steroidobacteraceae bacterium]